MRRLARLGEFFPHADRCSVPAYGRPRRIVHLLLRQDADEKIGGLIPRRPLCAGQPAPQECYRTLARGLAAELTTSSVQPKAWRLLESPLQMRLCIAFPARV